jgi:hypothetical protein
MYAWFIPKFFCLLPIGYFITAPMGLVFLHVPLLFLLLTCFILVLNWFFTWFKPENKRLEASLVFDTRILMSICVFKKGCPSNSRNICPSYYHKAMPLHVLPKSNKVAQPKEVYEVVLLACKSVNRGSRGISLIGCYLERTWRICFPSIIISSAIMGNMKVNFLPFLTQLLTCSCMLQWRKTRGIKRTARSWILLRRNT